MKKPAFIQGSGSIKEAEQKRTWADQYRKESWQSKKNKGNYKKNLGE